MFPSSPNFTNPFDHPFFQNPSSKQDHDPNSFLFTFPSFDHEIDSPLNQIFLQNQPMAGTDAMRLEEKEVNTNKVKSRRGLGVVPRRRTGKKDRHSKICTAQGIRDRRMRLSLQVARKFFDLQDMLGYDKASKTIEWLFTKSKKAIKELINHQHPPVISYAKSESFVTECDDEEVSENEEDSNKDIKKDERETRKSTEMRESREKARARARCRTREKMIVKLGQCYKANPSNDKIEKLGFSKSRFDGVDQESNSTKQEMISPYEAVYNSLGHQFADVGTIEKFLGNSSSSASWSLSDTTGFLGNWDLLNDDKINLFHYSVSLAGNPNSVYSMTTGFP